MIFAKSLTSTKSLREKKIDGNKKTLKKFCQFV